MSRDHRETDVCVAQAITNESVRRALTAQGDLIAVWAIAEPRAMSDRERRLTAAIYAQLPAVLEHVRREGRLPRHVPGGGREIGLRLLVQRRGLDLDLSEPEREVFEAIARDGVAPPERAVILDARTSLPSLG